MQRLKRVFSIDIETCPKCGGTNFFLAHFSRNPCPVSFHAGSVLTKKAF